MKLAVAILFLTAVVTANAFSFLGNAGGFPPSQFYQALLERHLQKILVQPDFPEDLQQRAIDTVANAETGFEECNSAAYPMPWMQKVCITQNYSRARSALTAIENEAAARAAQSSSVPPEYDYTNEL